MYENGCRLNQDSGIQIHVTDVENRGAFADEQVVREPSVQMNVIVRKQAVNIGPAHILLIQVINRDLRIIVEDHAGDDLVADVQILARAVLLHILAHRDDGAGALVAERHRDQAEGISLILVCVCAADTAAFYLDEDVAVSERRNRILPDVKMAQLGQNSHMCLGRKWVGCTRSARIGSAGGRGLSVGSV